MAVDLAKIDKNMGAANVIEDKSGYDFYDIDEDDEDDEEDDDEEKCPKCGKKKSECECEDDDKKVRLFGKKK